MARTRLLHPDAPLDEDIASLMPCARLVWAYLPCHADRAGRLADKPFKLKLAILPTDNVDMDQILNELAARNLIVRYEANGRRYIAIRSFLRYQHPHKNEVESDIPAPPEITEAPSITRVVPESSEKGRKHSGGDDPDTVIDTVIDTVKIPPTPQRGELVLLPPGMPATEAEFIGAVVAHYRTYHPRAFPRLNSKSDEWKKIRDRLKEGYTVDDLCRAIDGYHRSPFHCGENDKATKYLSLELMVRNGGKVAQGIELASARGSPVLGAKEQKGVRAAMSWIEKTTGQGESHAGTGQDAIRGGLEPVVGNVPR